VAVFDLSEPLDDAQRGLDKHLDGFDRRAVTDRQGWQKLAAPVVLNLLQRDLRGKPLHRGQPPIPKMPRLGLINDLDLINDVERIPALIEPRALFGRQRKCAGSAPNFLAR
jgi:hypothetical protein